jgi:hypothetical protein
MILSRVDKYLASRALTAPWTLTGTPGRDFSGAVVIPSLAESASLFFTLRSLAQNPGEFLSRYLVVVVVNHREDAPPSEKEDNLKTLEGLSKADPSMAGLQLAWVDAASPGLELPAKTGGVGMARKIGFDLAIPRLNLKEDPRALISLDADTLCRPDYLPSIEGHFRKAAAPGAVIPFCHQPGATVEEDQAIRRYELFLRVYVLGLSRAGSPYAFHTVGSAMACTAEGYARMGGMNHRGAGEDFYFLQHLAKTGGVSQVKGTVVYPSARTSHRVPFGTGRSMTDLLSRKDGAVFFYRLECFQILGDWLSLVEQSLGEEAELLRRKARKISAPLADFLEGNKFVSVWQKLRQNFRTPKNLSKGFHEWFDGLKTMKLIHHLSAGTYPRQNPEQAVLPLLRWAGPEPVEEIGPQLELLRRIQIGEPYENKKARNSLAF